MLDTQAADSEVELLANAEWARRHSASNDAQAPPWALALVKPSFRRNPVADETALCLLSDVGRGEEVGDELGSLRQACL